MHDIAKRIIQPGKRASRIVVDQQSEFNSAQKTLSEFFAAAAGIEGATGPGMPKISFAGMPKTSIEFAAGTDSAGLELVDVYLWIFKRLIDGKDMAPELMPLVYAQRHRGNTDEVSLRAIEHRWEQHFANAPPLEDMPPEQLEAAREIMAREEREQRRQVAGQSLLGPPHTLERGRFRPRGHIKNLDNGDSSRRNPWTSPNYYSTNPASQACAW